MLSVSEAVKWLNSIKEKYIHGGNDDYDERRREALALGAEALKSSEPKVLSKSDVLSNFHEVLFMEIKGELHITTVYEDINDKVWLYDDDSNYHRSVFISYNHVIVVDDEDYNKRWRCWDKIPSYDQRNEVAWEVGEKE